MIYIPKNMIEFVYINIHTLKYAHKYIQTHAHTHMHTHTYSHISYIIYKPMSLHLTHDHWYFNNCFHIGGGGPLIWDVFNIFYKY